MNTKQSIVFITIFFYGLFLFANECPKPLVPSPPPPSNDLCVNAIPLSIGATCTYTTYTTASATATSGVPAPGCSGSTYNDVWFTIIVPANGSISIDTQTGGISDGGMAIYSGTCGSMTLIACDDDSSPNGLMPQISKIGLTPGTTIYVRFWKYNGGTGGTFGICVTSPTPPIPTVQDCLGAIPVCQSTYSETLSYAGYGTYLDYTGDASCSGLCLETELNSVWYTFQVQTSGVLDFRITPNGPNTDYDWALFNLTNRNCSDLQTNLIYSMIASCNSAYSYGITGANTLTPNTNLDCQGPSSLNSAPINNKTLNVTAGQIYYLNMQNWSATTIGYTLDFSNSTATIFDNVKPFIDTILPVSCGSQQIQITFSENVVCNSVQVADFSLTGPSGNIPITSVSGIACAAGGTQENSFTFNVGQPLQAGTYNLTLDATASGSITDLCGNAAITSTINFVIPDFSSTIQASNNSPICTNDTLKLSSLPNGQISYSWSGPSSFTNATQNPKIANATTAMSGTYIVTITASGGCTATAQTTVTVNPLPIAPSIAAPAVCSGQNAVFTITGTVGDTISYTGVTGGTPASPVVIGATGSVTVTVPNATSNKTITIVSVSNGTCKLTPASLTATVTINANITPTFTLISSYCLGATPELLPISSNNSIIGSWSPTTIRTDSAATYTYTFTPSAGQCAVVATKIITINPILTPIFNALGPYCVGATPGTLSTTSTNGVTGIWNPATVSTTTAGTTAYIFTPAANQCAISDTMDVTVNINTIPTFTALGPYCVGATPVVLPTTSTNSIVGTWSPSTISTSSAGNITYTFTPTPAAGVCATTATMSISVTSNTIPTFSQLGPYCVGATSGTLPTTSNNGITGTWNPSTISTSTGGSSTYTFTPNVGQCAASTTMNVTINSSPSPTILGDLLLCTSESTTLTASGGVSYIWSTTQTGANITVSPTTTTSYTVTVTNNFGCTQTISATVVIKGNPIISAVDSTIETCSAGNGSITLSVSSGTQPYTYLWSNNGGNVATISNLSSGAYLVTVSDNAGCSTTKSIFLSNSPTPILSVSKIDDHCSQGVGEISINANGGNGNYTYTWDTQPVQTTPSINHLVFGTYKVVVSDNYCSDSIIVNIGNNQAPTAAFEIIPQISSMLNPEIRFHNLSSGGTSFNWSFGDGEFSAEENPFHVYHNAQNYLVYLVVQDDFGCSDTAFNTVIIYEDLGLFIPNAFTPNGDGINDVFKPYGKGYSLDGYKMLIFDRWGKMIFETTDIENGWDGKINGVLANVNDVLIYKIVIKDLNYLDHKYMGIFTILGSKNALGN